MNNFGHNFSKRARLERLQLMIHLLNSLHVCTESSDTEGTCQCVYSANKQDFQIIPAVATGYRGDESDVPSGDMPEYVDPPLEKRSRSRVRRRSPFRSLDLCLACDRASSRSSRAKSYTCLHAQCARKRSQIKAWKDSASQINGARLLLLHRSAREERSTGLTCLILFEDFSQSLKYA
jgi:hypothetical protein